MITNLPITGYQVVSGASVAALATAVETQLDLGWTLFGQPFTSDGTNFHQGLVKLGPQTQIQN